MKILPLVTYPDQLLQEVSKPVAKVDEKLKQFMKDMVSTMYYEGGIGLAAVQVGELKRILVMDLNYEIDEAAHHNHDHHGCSGIHVKNTNPRYFVNPEIITSSKETFVYNEGCLSFPGVRSEVVRPKKVKVKYLDFNGNEKLEEMDDLLATCIQHEMDHLNGINFIDHISRLKRDIIIAKMVKLKKRNK